MMRCLLQNNSISAVNQTSRPFRNQLLPSHKKAFLAVCWLMVLAPRLSSWVRLYSMAACMALKSNPLWVRKFWSSLHTAASCRLLGISSRETQSFSHTRLRPSSFCSMLRDSISQVNGGGKKRRNNTPARLSKTKYRARRFVHFQMKRTKRARVIPAAAMQRN